ncbi:FAS1 domain-containing protein [Amylocarpus encephaloides]|uniref:FAS1 domain-containing protein n=1 Tax=Amylocarpus encephaloides TaxID=45428 RepID=A0A9P8C0G5_9HELO|nr:FAS1 domain-containing protein [Amylocarpus encephaloides]
MRSPSTMLCISVLASSVTVRAVGLVDALKNAGASQFASLITSDPIIASLYLSSNVGTVFAPIDSSSPSRMKRQSPEERQKLKYQSTRQTNHIGDINKPPGKPLDTNNDDANVGAGNQQKVVTNPQDGTGNSSMKRGVIGRRSNMTMPSLLNIYSGLGNNVSIIQAGIPYDGGVIHIVNDYFTLPTSLSSTASTNGQSSFNQMSKTSNMSASLDSTASITCFIPSNAAFSASNSSSYSTSSSLISGHVIPNFVGYLPSLTDGATFTTQGGTKITVTVKNGDYFINNAKIIASNQIISNGVAHVIDSVIEPKSPPLIVSAAPAQERGVMLGVWSLVFCLVASLLV